MGIGNDFIDFNSSRGRSLVKGGDSHFLPLFFFGGGKVCPQKKNRRETKDLTLRLSL